MNTFVRVAEIWVPDADGYLLEFGGGVYDHAPDFGGVSRSMCFGRGEGLPGRVWEEGRPILMKDLQAGHFQRAAAAKAAQLVGALAFPVFLGDRLKAVVVLFCGDIAGQSGAIEIWRNDPRVTSDMTLRDGLYGAADAAFEAASRQTYLPRGAGLPGLAWQRQASVFIDGLSESVKFVRAQEAAATTLSAGFAIPCPVPGDENYVLAFLSAPSLPIAAGIERWAPGSAGEADPIVLDAFASGTPKARQRSAAQPSLIALPIVSDGAVAEVVSLVF